MTNPGNTVPQRPTPGIDFIWGLVSTALLAGWIWWQMGPMYALGGVIGIFVHEYGHVLAINRAGMGPGKIHIIPFLGGAATWKTPPDSEFTGALVALAGPAFGMVAALPFLVIATLTGEPEWLKAAFFISILNLMNLLPAPPLDGSKVLGPVLARGHPTLERGVLLLIGAAAVAWAVSRQSWIFAGFVAISMLGAFSRGPMRPPSRPLETREAFSLMAFFTATVFLCLVALQAIAEGMGRDNPFELLSGLVSFR